LIIGIWWEEKQFLELNQFCSQAGIVVAIRCALVSSGAGAMEAPFFLSQPTKHMGATQLMPGIFSSSHAQNFFPHFLLLLMDHQNISVIGSRGGEGFAID